MIHLRSSLFWSLALAVGLSSCATAGERAFDNNSRANLEVSAIGQASDVNEVRNQPMSESKAASGAGDERPNVYLELLVGEYLHGSAFTWAFDITNAQKGNVSGLTLAPGAGLISGMYDVISNLGKSFRLNLVALVENNQARVVTNPHVAVRSGLPGEINYKEELHVILTNSTENFGVTRALEKLEAGVHLNVTPQVLSNGFVNLKVEGEVSVFVPAPEGQFALNRQTVQTEVLVEGGKTLIIGGLVKKQVTSTKSGVPGLSRIPLLGKLFKSETSSESYVETVIYITPHVNEPGAFSPANMGRDVKRQFDGTAD